MPHGVRVSVRGAWHVALDMAVAERVDKYVTVGNPAAAKGFLESCCWVEKSYRYSRYLLGNTAVSISISITRRMYRYRQSRAFTARRADAWIPAVAFLDLF